MNDEEFRIGDYSADDSSTGEPMRDRKLGGMLARAESSYATNQVSVARQRYRIGVAARRQVHKQMLAQQPTWIDWTARAARPLPIGIAAALLLTAAGIMRVLPAPVESVAVENAAPPSLATLAAGGGTSEEIMDALIAPATSDSLLALALASSTPGKP